MKKIENKQFDEERALYGMDHIKFVKCSFAGVKDGESALKESRDLVCDGCEFDLRYPFWHVKNAKIQNSRMGEGCRAALWYDETVHIDSCKMNGIKAIRECKDIHISNSDVDSKEFCWLSNGIHVENSTVNSEYPFFYTKNLKIKHLKMTGKYSFQYCDGVEISNSELDTKDAFWHTKNVTVRDSVVKGEYLGWYSENLTLIGCKIIGTQPLCYCKKLTLKDCEMIDCDLSFEKSEVTEAIIKGNVTSVKNPVCGHIVADSYGEIIQDDENANRKDLKIETREN